MCQNNTHFHIKKLWYVICNMNDKTFSKKEKCDSGVQHTLYTYSSWGQCHGGSLLDDLVVIFVRVQNAVSPL